MRAPHLDDGVTHHRRRRPASCSGRRRRRRSLAAIRNVATCTWRGYYDVSLTRGGEGGHARLVTRTLQQDETSSIRHHQPVDNVYRWSGSVPADNDPR